MFKNSIILILLALFASCSSSSSWKFDTDYFQIEVDDRGFITSMKNVTIIPHREFSPEDKPSPLLSLYDSEKGVYYHPEKAEYISHSQLMRLTYSNASVAEINIEPSDKYLKLTLKSLSPRNGIENIQWGSYHTNITNLFGEIIGVARDTSEVVNYSIGMLALDDNTLGGTSDLEADISPFQYIIHTPDSARFPLPDHLHEGQVFTLGGDGISDVAFYAYKEPYYRILMGNSAVIDRKGQISLNYHARNRTFEREVYYSLIPNMKANTPNHLRVEAVPDVDYIGSSIALWGSPDSTALMNVIQTIVLSEGLPYPTINGKWVKDPSAYVPDLIVTENQYDSIIPYVSRLGFKTIYANEKGFLRADRGNGGYLDGRNYEKKPFHLKSGNKSHKEFAEMASKAGVLLGRVNIATSLAQGTMDASPNPSDSLCYQQKRLLMKNLSPTDTAIIVDDPKYMNEIASWEGHYEPLNIVKIGNELIHYLGVSETAPYTLLNVTRGYWNTKATAHQAKENIYKLQVTLGYGYEGLIPNLALQDKIAAYYADVAHLNGIGFYDFDGQEFLFNNGHGHYSIKRFFRTMFERAEALNIPTIRVTGANLMEGSWHYQSVWNAGGGKNMYDVDTREWGSATSQGKDLRDVTYSNYFPVSFGNNFAIKDTSTVEQYEHIQAISVGVGATYFLSINQKDVESCPQKDAIFQTISTWEDARAANAFPLFLKKQLANPIYDWRLEAIDDMNWILYRLVEGEKVESHALKCKY